MSTLHEAYFTVFGSRINRILWLNLSVFLIMILINTQLPTLGQLTGFVSIDCGGLTSNYTDPSTGIEWVSDAAMWPDIANWSSTASVILPTHLADQKQYSTLRYFPTSNEALNQSKFCYNLPAIGGNYYLIRASFWFSPTASYATRVSGQVRFRVLVDTYTGVEIVLDSTQVYPWFEEMYVQAQSGRSSVSVCLSTASNSSDVPFINSLELRPLPPAFNSVDIIRNTSYALRTVVREDTGTLSGSPTFLRYPNDTIDRLWWRFQHSADQVQVTNQPVEIDGLTNLPAEAVLLTNAYFSSFNINAYYDVLSAGTLGGSHEYYAVLAFAELDPRVNASGQRVFNVSINGDLLNDRVDIYAETGGLYKGLELYTNKPVGPFTESMNFVIAAQAAPTSLYPPTLAAFQVLQLFDKPMNATTPTSSSDAGAIQDLLASVLPSLQSFMGDPCLPQGYEYPWIACNSTNPALPARVTSILLSDSGLAGSIPNNIVAMDELTTLDLSNNSLSGAIPGSLSSLPKLTYLNLANNNFSGPIPAALLQKQGLVFRYAGNPFLCVTNHATCQSSQSLSEGKQHNNELIIIASVGAMLLFIIFTIIILCIFVRRKNRRLYSKRTPFNLNREEVNSAAHIIQEFTSQEIKVATKNFSDLLGEGGFGSVYQGKLQNGLDVAVKVLSKTSTQGPQEFLNEVTFLSRVHHKNLVGFVGYSIDGSLVLVYEFMSNGSLHDALSRGKATQTLTWLERLHILSDAAQGLAYLHHGHGCTIIHRDVKSSNILISKNLQGKMSDFGISKVVSIGTDNVTTRLIGTAGYLDPEYALTSNLTEKVDIFSFGVVLLECLSGQLPMFKDTTNDDIHIVEWARRSYERGMIEEIVDERLGKGYNLSSVWKVAEIAMACVQFEGINRPSMSSICSELSEAIRMESMYETIPTPTNEFPTTHSYVHAR